ncbi:MAG: FecR domain-containing protein [Thiobacillus sp.]
MTPPATVSVLIRAALFSVAAWVSPPVQAAAADGAPEWRYTVRPGDTLIGISARYLASPNRWPALQRLNRVDHPARLMPGSGLRIPLAWLRHEPAPVTVVTLAGTVRVNMPDVAERALTVGERLPAGAVVSTGTNSSLTLRFADGSQLTLQPQSRLMMDTLSVYTGGGMVDTRLRLQQGRVEVSANPRRTPGSRLQVITPSAVAAVRGTQFRVAAEDAIARQETIEGAVVLSAAGAHVAVTGGRGSLAEKGKAPLPPVALLPAPDMSSLPRQLDSLPLRFELPAHSAAVAWVGQIAPNARFETLLLEKTNASPTLTFTDIPDGRYVLRVRGVDAHGLQGRDGLHEFEVNARPFAPLSVAPARVREPKPRLTWTPVTGVEAYQFQLASDPGFARLLDEERISRAQRQSSQALPVGTVYWRVASIEQGETGPYSAAQTLTYDPLPSAPDLTSAVPGYAADTLRLSLPTPPVGLVYEWVLSGDATRSQPYGQGKSADGGLSVSSLPPGTYVLSARLVEADGTAGPWSTREVLAPASFRWETLLFLLPLLAL